MINLNQLEKTFQTKNSYQPVLKGISLGLVPGEIYGVIGKKGCGKTTLLRCITLLERPSSGSIEVDHYTLTNLSSDSLKIARRALGFLPKESHLLESKTVFENIALPLELMKLSTEEIHDRITALLPFLGLNDKAGVYPRNLSFASKKRVALGQALIVKPKVLLCDEPTEMIEPRSAQAILQLLKEVNERFTISILVCSEDIEVIKTLCHRVAVLQQGEIIEESTTREFFIKPKSALAKEWVKTSTRLELPTALRRRLKPKAFENSNTVLRLAFSNQAAQETLIAHIVQHFYLRINIMQAHLEALRYENIAVMIVEVIDEHNTLASAIEFLESQNLFVEILGYAANTH